MSVPSVIISLLLAAEQTCDAAIPLLRRMARLAGPERHDANSGRNLREIFAVRSELSRIIALAFQRVAPRSRSAADPRAVGELANSVHWIHLDNDRLGRQEPQS